MVRSFVLSTAGHSFEVATPRTNGFVERFNRTILDEFFRTAFRKKLYSTIDDLQTDLDIWLNLYNYERSHRGYRNMARKPIETFELGKIKKSQLTDTAAKFTFNPRGSTVR
jgi:hypothetical protein